ncbi:putative transcription factor C3H family [Dioscorea sansibarensis]
MDYNSNAIEIIPEPSAPGGSNSWASNLNDQALWATEDDYRSWNGETSVDSISNSVQDSRQGPSRAGGEQTPTKKARNDSQGNGSNSKSKAIGKMFFKTKLCCKFRAGTCPYITNCNFAHGIEELRKPPPNWQEIVAAHDEASEPREEHQIPIITSSNVSGDTQRSYKGRHCKKFYTEEGCPYGDACTFLHDEQSRSRESVAISLGPSMGSGGNYAAVANPTAQKPSNWKTRICNKWEMTGNCPFGSKCHFAHGAAELHKYGGGLVEIEGGSAPSAAQESKHAGVPSKAPTDTVVAANTSVPHVDVYHHIGAPTQRSVGVTQRQGQRPFQKWKGPDKISRIYGDWIDEIE